MNEHPSESLPAYVLGALDASEHMSVAQHLQSCASCRAEADEFRTIVAALPYAAEPQRPPERVRRQLMARVAADQDQRPARAVARSPQPAASFAPARRMARWPVATMIAATLSLLLALVTVDSRMQISALNAELGQSRQALTTLQATVAQQQQQLAASSEEQRQAVTFISAPRTVGQVLEAQRPGLQAKMYMQPGHNRVVILLNGLPTPAPGMVYQFWFASNGQPVPSRTFSVDSNGVVEVVIDAPQPVDGYGQVMVTVERDGGSATPSNDIVAAADLKT